MSEFVSFSHSIGNNIHHFEWCTKYRYKIFAKPYTAKLLRDILYEVANRYHIRIVEIGIMPDHIHMAIQLHPTMSQSKAMQLLKGASSYELLRAVPNLRLRYPQGHLWSRGNFKDSLGRLTSEAAQRYIREQNNIHQFSLSNFTGSCGL